MLESYDNAVEYFFQEFQQLLALAEEPRLPDEPESWMAWGYQQSLVREEAEMWLRNAPDNHAERLTALAHELCTEPRWCEEREEVEHAQPLFLGMGFFYGLWRSQQLSQWQFEELSLRLQRWSHNERRYKALLEELLDPGVAHEHKLILRQRAHLVQLLRQSQHPSWIALHRMLFCGESPAQERSSWLRDIREWLSDDELDSLIAIGHGALLPSEGGQVDNP